MSKEEDSLPQLMYRRRGPVGRPPIENSEEHPRERRKLSGAKAVPPIIEEDPNHEQKNSDKENDDDTVELTYNRRRHSAVGKPNLDTLGLLPSFADKNKGRNRRHSMMVFPQPRRISLDITEEQRRSLQLPRYSQVFGFSTFSGLPLIGYSDPVIQYENTYKMLPDKKFQTHVVRSVVERIVDDLLDWDDDVLTDNGKPPKGKREREAYEMAKHKRRSKLILKMVDEVKDEIKQLDFKRYKYVVNAIIGEIKGQGIRTASRCLWDTNLDNFICVQRRGRDCFVTVLVHAVYFE